MRDALRAPAYAVVGSEGLTSDLFSPGLSQPSGTAPRRACGSCSTTLKSARYSRSQTQRTHAHAPGLIRCCDSGERSTQVGPTYADLMDKCIRGAYQPSLIFFDCS